MSNHEILIQAIKEKEEIIKKAENLRNGAIAKKEVHEKNLKAKEEELKNLGTTPEEAEDKIKELEKEINEGLKFIDEHLPIERLKDWGVIE